MRLAVATTSYPRFPGDVAGNFVEGMVDALRERGHSVTVFAPDSEHATRDGVHWVRYLPRPLQRTFYEQGAPDNLRHPRAWLGALTFPLALRRALRERFDALISHFGVPCGVVGATLPVPQLVVWHSADVELARRMPARMREAIFARSRHWFVHHTHREALKLEGVVAPMGATVEHVDANNARTRWRMDGKTVLFVGRLVDVKGLDVLLDAARGASWSLIVAGPGAPPNAPSNVRFVGAVTSRERDELLAACDALAIPSRRLASGRTEGSPVIAQEGLLAGIPIVASQVGGLAELEVTHVPPDDPNALRAALDTEVERRREHRGGSTWPEVVARVEEQLQALI